MVRLFKENRSLQIYDGIEHTVITQGGENQFYYNIRDKTKSVSIIIETKSYTKYTILVTIIDNSIYIPAAE